MNLVELIQPVLVSRAEHTPMDGARNQHNGCTLDVEVEGDHFSQNVRLS